MVRATIIATITVLITVPALAQNLFVNPGFDIPDQLNGWTCTSSDGVPSWSPEDRMGSPSSGSLMHDVTAAVNNKTVWCWQCVPVNELWSYVASGWYYWPNDPDVSQLGSSRWSMYYYSDSDCTGSSTLGANVTGDHPMLDTWYHLETEETAAPTGAMSAVIYFITWQDIANEPVRARMDDLNFSTTTIFRDGFESSGVNVWSDSFP